MVEGVEKQFDMDFGGSGEVLVGEAEGDEDVDFENHGGAFAIKDDDDMSDVEEQTEDDAKVHIPAVRETGCEKAPREYRA